jgi:hypothetical protein
MHEEERYLIELAIQANLADSLIFAFAIYVALMLYYYGTRDDK